MHMIKEKEAKDRPPPQMAIVSNQENTHFEWRPIGGKWKDLGTAKIIYVKLADLVFPCELRAEPTGYRMRTMTLTEPMREIRWTFEIGDRTPAPAAPPDLSIQVHVTAASDGRVVLGTSETAKGHQDLPRALEKCGRRLIEQAGLKDKRIVVLQFKAGSGATDGDGTTAADALTTALTMSRQVVVIARDRVEGALKERGLTPKDLADRPDAAREVWRALGNDYTITGSVSVVKE